MPPLALRELERVADMWLRIYLYGLFQALIIDYFIWFIYLIHLGYSATQIGWGTALFSLTVLVLNIPSSWLADRFDKRTILFVSSIAKTIASVFFLLAALGFGLVIAGFIASGIAPALSSGVDLTYLQDVVTAGDCDRELLRFKLSRYIAMQTVASLIAGILGGVLAAWSFHIVYLADTVVGIITMLLVWLMPPTCKVRTSQKSRRNNGGSLWQPYLDAGKLLVHGFTGFRTATIVIIVVSTLSAVQTTYTQGLLKCEGLSTTNISLIFAATTLLAVGGAWLTARLKTLRLEQAGVSALTWLYAVSGALRAASLPVPTDTVILNTGGIAAGQLGSGMSGVLFNGQLLRNAPKESESLALSSVNTMQTFLMMAVSPLFGLLATHRGFHAVFTVCGALLAAVAVVSTMRLLPLKHKADSC